MTKDEAYIEKRKIKAFKRLQDSVSGYVLVKRFNASSRAGLRQLINQGEVEIIDTTFGRAYTFCKPQSQPVPVPVPPICVP